MITVFELCCFCNITLYIICNIRVIPTLTSIKINCEINRDDSAKRNTNKKSRNDSIQVGLGLGLGGAENHIFTFFFISFAIREFTLVGDLTYLITGIASYVPVADHSVSRLSRLAIASARQQPCIAAVIIEVDVPVMHA